jgi:hypothetical protein
VSTFGVGFGDKPPHAKHRDEKDRSCEEPVDARASLVIGVEPHKRLNAVVVLNAGGKVLARNQFANSAEGFRE